MMMKMIYKKPTLFVSDIKENVSLLAGSPQSPYVDAKEQTTVEDDDFFSEKEKDPLGELGFSSIWDDEKD